jgi:ketosteroid isomerase-like protein
VDRAEALALLTRLHSAQNSFYSGGDPGELYALLTSDITWHVPGSNLIAGTYRGRGEVTGYFTRRRDLAGHTFQITRRDVLTGAGHVIAALSDGEAMLAGTPRRWSTVGLYRIVAGRVAECWLLPTDPVLFDQIWSTQDETPDT